VFTQHPTLLIGPSDWDRERMPLEEFTRRIEALWAQFPAASCIIVYGTSSHHAELAYLTNLVPKLEAAAALICRDGKQKLFIGGGPNMVGATRPLTFVGELSALRGAHALATAAFEGIAGRRDEILVVGSGYMPTAFRWSLLDALAERVGVTEATAEVWALMRRKSAREIDAVREGCRLVSIAIDAIDDARRAGAGVTGAVLAGEQAANRAGAQDIRTLFSSDGGWTLRPFEVLVNQPADPLQVYVAVRRFNYWAEGFAMLSDRPSAIIGKAARALRSGLGAIKPDAPVGLAERTIAQAVAPDRVHPVTAGAFANAVGLALQEAPYTDAGKQFEAGEVYSVRAGITDCAKDHAIVSAMVAVTDRGHESLWMRNY
jgi:hypothetical protein